MTQQTRRENQDDFHNLKRAGGIRICRRCQEEFPSAETILDVRKVPAYTSDLNACALAEAEVERRGLAAAYVSRLIEAAGERFTQEQKDNLSDYECGFYVATANAELRATALAAVLGGEK